MNLLEPWVLLRLLGGLVAVVLFGFGARTSYRVLRHFDLRHATEGQLALEKQLELAATFVRVATAVQVALLALSSLAADRLSQSVRGAMCAFGVLNAEPWGFRAIGVTAGVALASGVLAQIYALDSRVRGLDLVRTVALATLAVAPLSLLDFLVTGRFLLNLDLTAAASCCSVQLDARDASGTTYPSGPRVAATVAAVVAIAVTVAIAFAASRRPRAATVALAGATTVVAFPLAIAASVLEVAPHAFEVPQHVCPFCLLRADVLGLGYPLFGAIFLATVWGAGAAVCGLLARGPASREAFKAFARERLRRGSVAWLVAVVLGAAPVVRYAWLAHGVSLFP